MLGDGDAQSVRGGRGARQEERRAWGLLAAVGGAAVGGVGASSSLTGHGKRLAVWGPRERPSSGALVRPAVGSQPGGSLLAPRSSCPGAYVVCARMVPPRRPGVPLDTPSQPPQRSRFWNEEGQLGTLAAATMCPSPARAQPSSPRVPSPPVRTARPMPDIPPQQRWLFSPLFWLLYEKCHLSP